jgi:hypothetical protein
MRRILSLLIVLAPVAAAAQNNLSTPAPDHAVDPRATKTVQKFPPLADSCPVGMRAQREMAGSAVNVTSEGTLHPGIAQRLRVILQSAKPKRIVSASITVHGYGPTPRVLDAGPATHQTSSASELTRTLDLTFNGSRSDLSADIVLSAFASVTQLDLNSIDYADGSARQFSAGQRCHIAPDPFMLVATR